MYLKALWALVLKIYWGEHCFFTLASLLYMSFNKDSIWCTPVLGVPLAYTFYCLAMSRFLSGIKPPSISLSFFVLLSFGEYPTQFVGMWFDDQYL